MTIKAYGLGYREIDRLADSLKKIAEHGIKKYIYEDPEEEKIEISYDVYEDDTIIYYNKKFYNFSDLEEEN